MGRIKQTNFHETTISKMMKSLAILAASLAAVQAQQGLGRLLKGEENQILNDNDDEAHHEAFCQENPEARRCRRGLKDVEGIIEKPDYEEHEEEDDGEVSRKEFAKALGKAFNNRRQLSGGSVT